MASSKDLLLPSIRPDFDPVPNTKYSDHSWGVISFFLNIGSPIAVLARACFPVALSITGSANTEKRLFILDWDK